MNPKSTTTRRERFLLTLFPAALVLAIYSVFFAYPLQRSYRDQNAAYRAAQLVAVSEVDAQAASDKLESTRQSLNRLKAKNQASLSSVQDLGHTWRNLQNRLDTYQQVTETLHANDLSVVYQGEATEPLVSAYCKSLTAIIDRQATQKLSFWEVEVEGSYPDMTNFLSELAEKKMNLVPVAISMKSSSESHGMIKNWKIVFLI